MVRFTEQSIKIVSGWLQNQSDSFLNEHDVLIYEALVYAVNNKQENEVIIPVKKGYGERHYYLITKELAQKILILYKIGV